MDEELALHTILNCEICNFIATRVKFFINDVGNSLTVDKSSKLFPVNNNIFPNTVNNFCKNNDIFKIAIFLLNNFLAANNTYYVNTSVFQTLSGLVYKMVLIIYYSDTAI